MSLFLLQYFVMSGPFEEIRCNQIIYQKPEHCMCLRNCLKAFFFFEVCKLGFGGIVYIHIFIFILQVASVYLV